MKEADPDPSPLFAVESVNGGRTVDLISNRARGDSESLEPWLKRQYAELFEIELAGWYTDPDVWPKQLAYQGPSLKCTQCTLIWKMARFATTKLNR
jgi:hypothetical protein